MPPQTRGAAKRARFMNAREQALAIVVSSGFLHWYEAVKLGETCKAMQYEWQEKKDHICEPLLVALDSLKNAANVCRSCQEVASPSIAERQCHCSAQHQDTPLAHLDPRFKQNYSTLSTWQKCKAMAEFTSLCVSNFRSNFDFTNLTDSNSIPQDFNLDWLTPEFRFLANEKPKRLAFMVNFVAANWGQGNLYLGYGISQFNQAFAGTDFDPNVDSTEDFEHTLGCCLVPPMNHVFEENIHRFRNEFLEGCGHSYVWETLGPVLTWKLDFLAPFINDDGTAFIPDDMEPITSEEEQCIVEMMLERYE